MLLVARHLHHDDVAGDVGDRKLVGMIGRYDGDWLLADDDSAGGGDSIKGSTSVAISHLIIKAMSS